MDQNAGRHLARRIREQAASATVAGSERTRLLRARGLDVIDLSAGDPDLPTPEHIRRAAAEAIEGGETHYVDGAGLPELREAIAEKLRGENGIACSAAGVLVTPGAKAALFEAALAYLEPGVEALVLEPAWVSYAPIVQLAGARAVGVPLASSDGFRITREKLEAAIGPATRLLFVNSPNNPTGRVLDPEELQAIASAAQAHDLLVFSDEIYEKITFDGRIHRSVAALPGMTERTLTFNGFSKSYAMTGWRLGYVAGPEALIAPIRRIHSHAVTCVAPFVQRAGLAALRGPQDFLAEAAARHAQCREHILGLNRLRGLRCTPPEGAFYAFADARGLGASDVQLAERLLLEAHVSCTPGSAFGEAASGHLRFAFAIPPDRIDEAIDRMGRVLGWR